MSKTILNNVCFLLCIVLSLSLVHSLPVNAADIEVRVKPRLCVLSASETECSDEVVISWKSKKTLHACLYQGEIKEPIFCWQNADKGKVKQQVGASSSVEFYLRDLELNTLASTNFEVIQDHKKYRRGRRNPWSFF